jgi:hypothetical protein
VAAADPGSLYFSKRMGRKRPPLKSAAQEARALAERQANRKARKAGSPLPYPSLWDLLDPTKVDPRASPKEIRESARAFRELCRPRPRKEHFL